MPIKLVVDSSVIVKWLNRTNEKKLGQADKVMSDAEGGKVTLLTLELAKYEVGNVFLFSKKLTLSEAKTSLASLYNLPLSFLPQDNSLAAESFRIAQDTKITYYDASFMALAKQENAVLVTDNPKHQAKIKGIKGIKVVPLGNYK